MKLRQLISIYLFMTCALQLLGQKAENVQITKIWDKGEHNAFTDLIRFKGNFYCVFREGSGHVGGSDGKIRILQSKDGQIWNELALLEKKGFDLRDAKLSITPQGRIMVIIGGSIYVDKILKGRIPHVSFSNSTGTTFSDPESVEIDPTIVSWGDWIWRVTWHKGIGYGIDYQVGPDERKGPTSLFLVKTLDGKKYTKVSKLELSGFPNEATIRIDKQNTMHTMIRRELDDKVGVMAKSTYPYVDWNFQKMPMRLGGPNFIFDKNQTNIIAATRIHEGTNLSTGIFVKKGSEDFKEIIRLPSGGDTSYAGMVNYGNYLWVSYYSSHEGKASIYLAKIPLSYLKKVIHQLN